MWLQSEMMRSKPKRVSGVFVETGFMIRLGYRLQAMVEVTAAKSDLLNSGDTTNCREHPVQQFIPTSITSY